MLDLADLTPLREAFTQRYQCPTCLKSANAFCYRCASLGPSLQGRTPLVQLPCPLVIIKDVRELESKSTAVHARLLATPVYAYDYDQGAVDYTPHDAVLLFPSDDAVSAAEVDWSKVKEIVAIDGTWRQAKAMSQSPALKEIPRVKLSETNETLFWRYQQFGPHCLSTIEAIRAIYREREMVLKGVENYDNLLWFFIHQYEMIQEDYRNNPERHYTSRHRSDYIKK